MMWVGQQTNQAKSINIALSNFLALLHQLYFLQVPHHLSAAHLYDGSLNICQFIQHFSHYMMLYLCPRTILPLSHSLCPFAAIKLFLLEEQFLLICLECLHHVQQLVNRKKCLICHEYIQVLLQVLCVKQLGSVNLELFNDRCKWFIDVKQGSKASDVLLGPVDATSGEYF